MERRTLTENQKYEILEKQEHLCKWCKKPYVNYEYDHIAELWEGGSNNLDNFQALCYECHKQKTAMNRNKRLLLERRSMNEEETIDSDIERDNGEISESESMSEKKVIIYENQTVKRSIKDKNFDPILDANKQVIYADYTVNDLNTLLYVLEDQLKITRERLKYYEETIGELTKDNDMKTTYMSRIFSKHNDEDLKKVILPHMAYKIGISHIMADIKVHPEKFDAKTLTMITSLYESSNINDQ
jgi:hypothetical protein